MGSIALALSRAAEEAGVTILTGRNVTRIDVRDGRARGVLLEDGERIEANTVVANADAKSLFLRLLDEQWLSDEVTSAVKRIRTESNCFKINLAARELPRWSSYDARGLADTNPGSISVAENLEELETAFEAARHGRMAERPYLWVVTPSAFDPTVAPPGQHVVSILGGHVPYTLKGRAWDDGARDELYQIVIRQICRYAPGFDRSVIHRQVLVPPDLERMFGLPGGHVHHAELSIDQIFFRRPIAHYANYRAPVASLYMCGASTHPGGGVTGVPGHNAAREILRDLGRAVR
jgi:phytoene dehydrogenase-like protein